MKLMNLHGTADAIWMSRPGDKRQYCWDNLLTWWIGFFRCFLTTGDTTHFMFFFRFFKNALCEIGCFELLVVLWRHLTVNFYKCNKIAVRSLNIYFYLLIDDVSVCVVSSGCFVPKIDVWPWSTIHLTWLINSVTKGHSKMTPGLNFAKMSTTRKMLP